jgi:hypothetical protein
MMGRKIIATVSLKELRRVASQIDHMEVAAEHHFADDAADA